MILVGTLFLIACVALNSAEPGTTREKVGAVLLLASALAVPLTLIF